MGVSFCTVHVDEQNVVTNAFCGNHYKSRSGFTISEYGKIFIMYLVF